TVLENMPLTPSGKLDRRGLPQTTAVAAAREYAPPATPLQEVLASVWSEVLEVEAGTDDNFFELGGDSLRAIEAVGRAREKGLNASVADILRFQTIRGLASHLETLAKADAPAIRVAPFSLLSEADRSRLPEGTDDAFPM